AAIHRTPRRALRRELETTRARRRLPNVTRRRAELAWARGPPTTPTAWPRAPDAALEAPRLKCPPLTVSSGPVRRPYRPWDPPLGSRPVPKATASPPRCFRDDRRYRRAALEG